MSHLFSDRTATLAGMAGSLFPDVDLLYFHLLDHRQHLHHGYWTHIPAFWLCVVSLWLGLGCLAKSSRTIFLAAIVGSNVFLHLLLDTVAGKIRWLSPFSEQDFFIVSVPARFDWWVLNFVFHWSFLLEMLIVLWAGILFLRKSSERMSE